MESSTELVVARYAEDLRWLNNAPTSLRVSVYDKNPASIWPAAKPLPNIGREAHTYLHHVVERYETLAPLTIFAQGHPFDHAFDFHQTLRRLANGPQNLNSDNGFEWIGHLIDTDDARGERLFVAWSKNENNRRLDVDGFHRALLGEAGPPFYTFRGGAQFAIARETLRRHPLDFYRRALEISISFPDAAHCFERAWPLVFGVSNPDLEWLQGRRTAFLKPMKCGLSNGD